MWSVLMSHMANTHLKIRFILIVQVVVQKDNEIFQSLKEYPFHRFIHTSLIIGIVDKCKS